MKPAAMLLLALLQAGCDPGPVHRAPDGHLEGRGHYAGSQRSGRWTLFDFAGSPRVAGDFVGGHPDGTWKRFFADGALQERMQLRAGVPDGPSATWHGHGRPASFGSYRQGLPDGPWRFWSPDGALDPVRSGVYRAGVRQP